MCAAGGSVTCVAMILTTRGLDQDPGTLDAWLAEVQGFQGDGCDISWRYVDIKGVTRFQGIKQLSEQELCKELANDSGVVANVGGDHWVLLTGCLGKGVFSVNDPMNKHTTYAMKDILQEAIYH